MKVVTRSLRIAIASGFLLCCLLGTQAAPKRSGPPAHKAPASLPPAFAISTIQEINIATGKPWPTDAATDQNDVYTGEQVLITFDTALNDASGTVEGKEIALEPTADAKTWRLMIPLFSAQSSPVAPHRFAFKGASTAKTPLPLSGPSRNLMVYPAPHALISGIEQKVVAADPTISRSGSKAYLTVTGDGFFAPAGRLHLSVGQQAALLQEVSPDGKRIYALLDSGTQAGMQPVQLEIWNTTATLKDPTVGQIQVVRSGLPQDSLFTALIVFFLIVALILWLVGSKNPIRLPRFLEPLLLERQNNTYSLSYFQFYLWSSIIVLGWLFIFAMRGFVNNDWHFPDLSGFAYTFLISLGTLIAAQATNSSKGTKGSGQVNPSLSDFILNGGVPAPERIQHFVWTLAGGCVYLVIIYQGYQTITTLPTIPNELLVLMGISSAGYVGGKMARKPGPIITQVLTLSDRLIEIRGIHLSKLCQIRLDDQPLPQTAIRPTRNDAELPDEFATAIQITLPALPHFAWFDAAQPDQAHHIVLVNTDAQQSEWRKQPDPPPVNPPQVPPVAPAPAPVNPPQVPPAAPAPVNPPQVLPVAPAPAPVAPVHPAPPAPIPNANPVRPAVLEPVEDKQEQQATGQNQRP